MNKTDKVLELVTAFKNNQTIEYFLSGEWIEVKTVDTILEYCLHGYSIRIKSTPKYRPYETLEEFLSDKKMHGPGLHPEYDKKMMFFPQRVSGEGKYVSLDAEAYKTLSFDKMINTPWVWEDGKVCGILEE